MNEDLILRLLSEAFHGEALSHMGSLLLRMHGLVTDMPCTGEDLSPHFVAIFIHTMKTLMSIRQKAMQGLRALSSDATALYELDRMERSLSNITGTALLGSFYVFACMPLEGSRRGVLYQRAIDMAAKDGVCLPDNCSERAVIDSLASVGDRYSLNTSTLDPTTALNAHAIVRFLWPLKRIPLVWDPQGSFLSWLRRHFDGVFFDYAELVSHREFFCKALLRAGSTDSMIVVTNAPPVMDQHIVRALIKIFKGQMGVQREDGKKSRVIVIFRDEMEAPNLHPADMDSFAFVDATLDEPSGIHYAVSCLGQALYPTKYAEWVEALRCSIHPLGAPVSAHFRAASEQKYLDLCRSVHAAACVVHLLFMILHRTRSNERTYQALWRQIQKDFRERCVEVTTQYYYSELQPLHIPTEDIMEGEVRLPGDEEHAPRFNADISLASGILHVLLDSSNVPQVLVAAYECRLMAGAYSVLSRGLNQCGLIGFMRQRLLVDEVALAGRFKMTVAQLSSRATALHISDPPRTDADYLESTVLYNEMRAQTSYEADVEEFMALCLLASEPSYYQHLPACVDPASMLCYYHDVKTLWRSLREAQRQYFSVTCGNHSRCLRGLFPPEPREMMEKKGFELLSAMDPSNARATLEATSESQGLEATIMMRRRLEKRLNPNGEGVLLGPAECASHGVCVTNLQEK